MSDHKETGKCVMIESLGMVFVDGAVYTQKPGIVMPLYETEREVLECFMESVCRGEDFRRLFDSL